MCVCSLWGYMQLKQTGSGRLPDGLTTAAPSYWAVKHTHTHTGVHTQTHTHTHAHTHTEVHTQTHTHKHTHTHAHTHTSSCMLMTLALGGVRLWPHSRTFFFFCFLLSLPFTASPPPLRIASTPSALPRLVNQALPVKRRHGIGRHSTKETLIDRRWRRRSAWTVSERWAGRRWMTLVSQSVSPWITLQPTWEFTTFGLSSHLNQTFYLLLKVSFSSLRCRGNYPAAG